MSESMDAAGRFIGILSQRRGPMMSDRTREKASLRDISPCSEYTRFTMEGTLRDPFSELAVHLDVPSLGTLFTNGPLIEPRWSQTLGYGLAIIEDDTRVHLYRSGKFVIRRARDRDHVEACYDLICDLVRPSMMMPRTGMTLYEAVALERHFHRFLPEDVLPQTIAWPGNGPVDEMTPGSFVDGPEGVRSSLRNILFPNLISILSDPTGKEASSGLDTLKGAVLTSLRSTMSSHRWRSPWMSSTACIHLASLTALELFSESLSAGNRVSLKKAALDRYLDVSVKEDGPVPWGQGELDPPEALPFILLP